MHPTASSASVTAIDEERKGSFPDNYGTVTPPNWDGSDSDSKSPRILYDRCVETLRFSDDRCANPREIIELQEGRLATLCNQCVTLWGLSESTSKFAIEKLFSIPKGQDVHSMGIFGGSLMLSTTTEGEKNSVITFYDPMTLEEKRQIKEDVKHGYSHLVEVDVMTIGTASAKEVKPGDGYVVSFYSLVNARHSLSFCNHPKPVTALISPQAGVLVSGSIDGRVRLMTKRVKEKIYEFHKSTVTDLGTIDPSTLLSVSEDKFLYLFDLRRGAVKQKIEHSDPLTKLASDGRSIVATGSVSGEVRIWDVRSGSRSSVGKVEHPSKKAITSLTFLCDGSIAAGTDDGLLTQFRFGERP